MRSSRERAVWKKKNRSDGAVWLIKLRRCAEIGLREGSLQSDRERSLITRLRVKVSHGYRFVVGQLSNETFVRKDAETTTLNESNRGVHVESVLSHYESNDQRCRPTHSGVAVHQNALISLQSLGDVRKEHFKQLYQRLRRMFVQIQLPIRKRSRKSRSNQMSFALVTDTDNVSDAGSVQFVHLECD
jgi:hypothetical protein